VLIGNEKIMRDAIRIRKVFGGNMRQVGYLAAAGIYALDNNLERLAEDHKKAKEIGELLSTMSIIKKVEPVETNIVIFELETSVNEKDFLRTLEAHNIKIIGMGSHKLRIVTHLDYSSKMHDKLLSTLKELTF
jgi:threonine aldolase